MSLKNFLNIDIKEMKENNRKKEVEELERLQPIPEVVKKLFGGNEFEIGKNFAEVFMEDGIPDIIEFYILPEGWDDNTDNLEGLQIEDIVWEKRIRLSVSAIYGSGNGKGKQILNIELMKKNRKRELEELERLKHKLYPLTKCIVCSNEIHHNHNALLCLKCSEKYTIEEINKKENKFKELLQLNQFIKEFEKDLTDPNYDENINSKEILRHDLKLMLEDKIKLEKEIRLHSALITNEITISEEAEEEKAEKVIEEQLTKKFEEDNLKDAIEENELREQYKSETGKDALTLKNTIRKDYLKWINEQ